MVFTVSAAVTPPSLLFFMGLAGAGKTFCGTLVAQRLGYFSYDLDQDLIPEMQDAIRSRTAFTPEMRSKYFKVISDKIGELSAIHPKLILMQAAYKRENREFLLEHHPTLIFIHVAAPIDLIMARLRKRGDSILPEYAQTMARGFEAPKGSPILVNDTEDTRELVARFSALFGLYSP